MKTTDLELVETEALVGELKRRFTGLALAMSRDMSGSGGEFFVHHHGNPFEVVGLADHLMHHVRAEIFGHSSHDEK
jgi:hypothetical protein